MLLIVLHSPVLTAKPLASYGRVYNVQDFIDASGGNDQLGLLRCLTTVKERLWDHPENHTIIIPSRLTQAYTIQEQLTCMGTSPGQTNGMLPRNNAGSSVWITIMGLDLTDDELEEQFPDLTNTMLPNTTYTSNTDYLGGSYTLHGQVSTQAMTDFLNQHISSTNMHCNLNPASEHFLSFSVSPRMPRLESVSTVNHNFFYFKNDVVASAPHATGINIMGLHLKGINNATNTCIYDANSPQQNNLFQYGIGIHLERLKFVALDQLFIEDMYGTGILVNNKEVAGTNDSVTVRDNILHNVWALKYMLVTQGNNTTYDDGGDGITFQGIWQGVTERNWVLNNTGYTGQFGRIGIAAPAEFNRDVTIRHNQVSGYDRGVHVENNGGGFTIAANRLTGSETAIVFDSFQDGCPAIRSSQVVANYMSNEGIPTNQSGLIKLYPPHLFFTSGAFTTNLHNKTLLEKNYALMTAGGITAYATPNGIVFPYGNFSAATGRWHVLSAIRRMQLDCNIFRTEGMAPGFSNGGMSLLASIPGLGPCSVAAEDVGLPHFPFRVENNLFQDLNTLSINPYTNGLHVLGANVVGYLNQGNTPQPSVAVYSNGLTPGIPNCAQTWDNTLCNGKPLVAEHDYLWDNTTLGTTGSHTGETILVGGTLTIAANLSFENCIFLMAPGAQIQISNGFTLTLDHCVLQAACDALWDGIYADNPFEELIIQNGCTLRDMSNGIQVLSGAKVFIENSKFLDNIKGLEFTATPSGYVTGVNGNQGIVEHNEFSSTGAGPMYLQPGVWQGTIGIQVSGCNELRLGNLQLDKGNHFSKLETGILVQHAVTNPDSKLWLFNNSFHDIRSTQPGQVMDDEAIIANTYLTPAGAGVFIMRSPSVTPFLPGFIPYVRIEALPQQVSFSRCDKAVAGYRAGIDVLKYKIEDCITGVMMNDLQYQTCNVNLNQIDRVLAGIQLIGDVKEAWVEQNIIHLRPIYTELGPRPLGIDVRFWTNLHNAPVKVYDNTISQPGYKGIGINVSKTGQGTHLKGNTTAFTTQAPYVPGGGAITAAQMHGIVCDQTAKGKLECNLVNGMQSPGASFQRFTSGYTLVRAPQMQLSCNQVNNSRFGIQVRGDCITDKTAIKANIMENHVHGLSTVPYVFSDQGNVGDIGDQGVMDNRNQFLGTYLGSNTYRWWSIGSNKVVQYIYSSLSTTTNSNDPPYSYSVALELTNSQICNNSILCGSTWQQISASNFDDGQAIEIAEDSIEYYTFPELSNWAAQYRLYSDLEMDSTLLASNAILGSFYQIKRYEDLGILRSVEQWINLLSDSTSHTDSILFLNRWYAAKAANDSVFGTENYIQNEKWVNNLMLEFLRYGRDSLSTEELEQLQTLAHSCPAIEGLGVFYARFLNAFFEPLTEFDDYQLCNGSNKGGKGPFDDFLTFLLGSQQVTNESNDNQGLILFPVPNNTVLNFKLNLEARQDGHLEIFDLTGKLVAWRAVTKETSSGQISTANLAPGMYVCRYYCGNDVFFGKINVIQ